MALRRCSISRLARWLLFLFIVAAIGVRPRHAGAQELSGTIRYTGSKGGQVSESRPILIAVQSQLGAKGEVDRQSITTNGGAFTLHAPVAGQYFLYYLLDVINIRDGSGFPGEPAGIYNRRDGGCTLQGDPITVPQSGLNLEFDDACILTGIGGTVTYTGNLSGRGIIIQAFADPDMNTPPAATYIYARNGGYYGVITFDTNVYYLRALLDVNGDGIFQPGEPFAICGRPIQAGADQTGVNITFDDSGASTCIVPSLPTPTPTPTEAPPPTVTPSPSTVTLAGTICYSGSHRAVSADHRILVFMCDALTLAEATSCTKARVTSNCGAFAFEAPAVGNYSLLYGLEGERRGDINIGSPFEISNNRCSFPADPVAVPQSDVRLDFGDTCILSGIAGNMTYTGNQGPISRNQPLRVEAFSDPAFERGRHPWLGNQDSNGPGYDIPTWDEATYYLRAFFDLNNNGTLDPGEPFQIYNNKSVPPGDPVAASTTQTNINFTFGDENVMPSACVGDCDGLSAVTVNEIITLVNIALGTADNAACPHGMPAGSTVDISLIIQAVNNALRNCPGT